VRWVCGWACGWACGFWDTGRSYEVPLDEINETMLTGRSVQFEDFNAGRNRSGLVLATCNDVRLT
jgi:hypothetical protein